MVEHEWYSFELVDDALTLTFRWTSNTASMTEADFRQAIERYAESAERFRPSGLLVDVRQLQYQGGPPPSDWRETEIVPRYLGAGATRMAYLSRNAAPQEHEGPLSERWFTNEDDARAWLGSLS